MKQVLFMVVLAAGMLLTGCSKDEDNSMKFTISESSISLLAHDDYKITPSGAFTARSTNEDVATVSSDGTIHAVSAGNADIIFTSVESPTITQTCKVNVDWRYKYFDEPILDFTMSVEEVKQRETHPLYAEGGWGEAYQYFPDAPDPYFIWYEYINGITPMFVSYRFLDWKSPGIVEIRIDFKKIQTEMLQQLEERYGRPTESKDNKEHKLFVHKNNEYYIKCYPVAIVYRKEPFE